MKERIRRSFSKQFKDDAVRQVVDGGKKIVETERELGLSAGTLGRWLRESSQRGEERFVGKGNVTSLEDENRRLRRENARLLEERIILKKAAKFMLLEKP